MLLGGFLLLCLMFPRIHLICLKFFILITWSLTKRWGYFAFATFLGNEVGILSLTTSSKRGSRQCYDGLTPSRARHGNTLSLRSAFFLKGMSVLFPEKRHLRLLCFPFLTDFHLSFGTPFHFMHLFFNASFFFSFCKEMFWKVWQRLPLSRANLTGQNGMYASGIV